ncbi:MAG: hypothetical protein II777_10610 [Clostridia bacterium]|nr:hypothetical protein [Clostridia bacterium]
MITVPMRVETSTVEIPMRASGGEAVRMEIEPKFDFAPRAVYPGPYVIQPTVSEQTFETAEKAMTDDIVVKAFPWSWLGSTVEKLDLTYSEETALEDTDYATWTPSTTAAVIQDTANITTTIAADMSNYEYFFHWRFRFDAAYTSGTAPKATIDVECQEVWQHAFRRPSNLTNIDTGTSNSQTTISLATAPLLVYYGSTGTKTMTYANSSGIYPTVQAVGFSSTSSLTPTITVKTPKIYAKCNGTYFATGMAEALDQEASKWKMDFECFRVPTNGVMKVLYDNLVDIYLNGI